MGFMPEPVQVPSKAMVVRASLISQAIACWQPVRVPLLA